MFLGGLALALAACVRGPGQPVAGEGEGLWYTAQTGDSLPSLARRTGVPAERIARINGLASAAQPLAAGTRVWVPGALSVGPDPLAPAAPRPPGPKTPATAPVAGPRYEVVPRSAWTSEPVGPNHVLLEKVTRITVHHTDEHGGMADLSDIEVVRRIEHYHRGPEKRWAAIGYHFLVGKDGKIYEGRPVKYQGAHTSANNEGNLGISVIGDCERHLPNAKQLIALKAFLDDQRQRYGVSKGRLYGHRDLRPTTCPGAMLYQWLEVYRRQ